MFFPVSRDARKFCIVKVLLHSPLLNTGTQVTLTLLEKTQVIANNKPLSSSPVSKNNDDGESDSITIDDEN